MQEEAEREALSQLQEDATLAEEAKTRRARATRERERDLATQRSRSSPGPVRPSEFERGREALPRGWKKALNSDKFKAHVLETFESKVKVGAGWTCRVLAASDETVSNDSLPRGCGQHGRARAWRRQRSWRRS